jgi:hypothetical protein
MRGSRDLLKRALAASAKGIAQLRFEQHTREDFLVGGIGAVGYALK